MRTRPYIQGQGQFATIDYIAQLLTGVEPKELLFCFAYATFSGCAEFQRRFGDSFWRDNRTRWLFGIDYGRTAPSALKFISSKPNASVRIANGVEVLYSPGFVPNQDFHMKVCLASDRLKQKYGLVAGSGNFSRNGLSESLECGTLVIARNKKEYKRLQRAFEDAGELWDGADGIEEIVGEYQDRWSRTIFRTPEVKLQIEEEEEDEEADDLPEIIAADEANYRFFWIDAGYVTRNRGPERPGNQIDLPRGAHRFFGLHAAPDQQRNSPIGDITFVFDVADDVVRALRLGNNLMEKITLPIPEEHAIGAYDGTLIEFERVDGGFRIRTFEPNEYLFAFGRNEDFILRRMDSGRPFGFRN